MKLIRSSLCSKFAASCPILSLINPNHALAPYFVESCFNIILQSKWYIFLWDLHSSCCMNPFLVSYSLFSLLLLSSVLFCFLLFTPMRAARPVHRILLDLITLKQQGDYYKSRSCSSVIFSCLLSVPVISSKKIVNVINGKFLCCGSV
jgi:hypothetical protein